MDPREKQHRHDGEVEGGRPSDHARRETTTDDAFDRAAAERLAAAQWNTTSGAAAGPLLAAPGAPAQAAPAKKPKPLRNRIPELTAKRDELRKLFTDRTTATFEIFTTVVGIYTRDHFAQWEVWRKEMQAFGEEGWKLLQEVDYDKIADSDLKPSDPADAKIIEELFRLREAFRFIWMDFNDHHIPTTTRVTVVERVDDVTFTVKMTVAERKSDDALALYLDKIKSTYEAESQKKSGAAKP